MAADIGIILPKVRIRDNFQLDQHEYRIKIAGMPVAEARSIPDQLLAMDSGMTTGKVPGIDDHAIRPSARRPLWIEPSRRDQAEMLGYTVVEPAAVIATHLTETVRKHADEILTRDATKHLIDELQADLAGRRRRVDPRPDEAGRSAADPADAACASRCRSASSARSWRRWATTRRGPRTRCC